MLEFYTQARAAPMLRESRTAKGLPVPMVECIQAPGDLVMPVVPELVLSQLVGPPFRYACDLGAGPFSGHAQPMNFVVIAPQVHSYCHMADRACLRFVGIPGDVARACLERDADDPLDFGPLHTRHHHDPLIAQALDALWPEMARDDPAARLFIDSMIAALVVRVARLAEQARHIDTHRGGLAPHLSARVIEYMQCHLDEHLTLQDLADVAGLSPWHFARAFRHSHGLPPHRYLTQLRIQHARTLLTDTSLPVTAVAAAAGYSVAQLARHFRHVVGISPEAYRQHILTRP
ncbi:helix-turn-helix domain-containing protein [Ectothiorhodospira sp. BSL-9]|uniref:helix-turn-helix domain-containing protein n=1 Tax=Ectothiorhodospira sp. BSL-9 TaxID=1442136 RepID=UPI0007B4294C|nr:AraC family transcriptional regulator [Ectothiorhodospira sp. BSL-9]ANB03678.1 AraC family transcriptional regulator [Ectothiorhodospira sp. BSL-9]